MKVILSITSIPTRFQYLKPLVQHLKEIKGCDEVWVNIPKKYNSSVIKKITKYYNDSTKIQKNLVIQE